MKGWERRKWEKLTRKEKIDSIWWETMGGRLEESGVGWEKIPPVIPLLNLLNGASSIRFNLAEPYN